MKKFYIAKSRRIRSTPYSSRIEKQGVTAYTTYNHMLLPAAFGSLEETYYHLKENVPTEVPGIAFLSGGQTEIEATQNLNEINKINDTNFLMSFSYGRALQQSALKNWAKDIKDTSKTQKIFNHRSKMNGLSTSAKWTMNLEKQINV